DISNSFTFTSYSWNLFWTHGNFSIGFGSSIRFNNPLQYSCIIF
ncbi:uvrD/REP helicase N-terminal domain protein, partial [Chlamydia psittaci 84-8471/1]